MHKNHYPLKFFNSRSKFLIAALVAMSSLFPQWITATTTVTVGDLCYEIDETTNEAMLCGMRVGVSSIHDLVIPDFVTHNGTDYPVTSIRNMAFFLYSNWLTGSLTIGNSVKVIGKNAFSYCSGLTGSLTIGNSVQVIGESAFENCSGFTGSLTIPNSVQAIGNSAFSGCSGFTGSLIIPNSVDIIGYGTFADCNGFNGSLTIGNSVETIGEGAFNRCSGFTGSLIIPNSVKTIEGGAFSDCTGFTGSLAIGNSVTIIGGGAFSSCSGFTGSLTIPNSVKTIGGDAFWGCSGFTGSLTIGNSVETIELAAFCECTGFTGSLSIPNSVQTIGDDAFWGCSGFSGSLTIGNSVTTIGERAFSGCSGFTGSLTIPNSVQIIRGQAFCDCSGFSGSLTIGNSVTIIGGGAFYSCSGFTGSLTIPNSVETIDDDAFGNCWGFTGSLIIGNSVETIGKSAFKRCLGIGNNGPLIIGSSVRTIGDGAFEGCVSLTDPLTIPNSVYTIGAHAFDNCGFTGLLTIGNSVQTIGDKAFWGCSGIEHIYLPASLQSIGMLAFSKIYVEDINNPGEYITKSNIKSVTCAAITPPIIDADNMAFDTPTHNSAKLIVPNESLELYRNAIEWKEFQNVQGLQVDAEAVELNVTSANVKAGESLQLMATVLPAETTDKSVVWTSSDEAVTTVDADGIVTGVGAGTATITATTVNRLTAECVVTVFLMGDSNGDGSVDIADVVNITNYIAGNLVNVFVKEAADMTGDGEITVTDAVMVARLILSSDISERRSATIRKAAAKNRDYLTATRSGDKLVLTLSGSGYTAFQADVCLPEGIEFISAAAAAGASADHIVMSARKADNTVRILLFALNSAELAAGLPAVELTLGGEGAGEVSLVNIVASDSEGRSVALGSGDEQTGIEAAVADGVDIYATAEGIAVSNAVGLTINIYTPEGRTVRTLKATDATERIALVKGLYIVKVGSTTRKVVK